MKRRIYNLKARSSRMLTQSMVERMGKVMNEVDLENLTLSKENIDEKHINEFSVSVDSATSLLNTYFKVKDNWDDSEISTLNRLLKSNQNKSIVFLNAYMKNLFQIYLLDKEMQNIIVSNLNASNPDLDHLSKRVEERWRLFFPFSQNFNSKKANLRTLISILLSGLHFYILQSKSENSIFYKVDINSNEGIVEVERSIWKILNWSFQ